MTNEPLDANMIRRPEKKKTTFADIALWVLITETTIAVLVLMYAFYKAIHG